MKKKICEKKTEKKEERKLFTIILSSLYLLFFFAFDLERRKYTQNMCCPAQNVLAY